MKRTTAAGLAAALLVTLAAGASLAGQAAAVSSKEALDALAKMIAATGGRKALESVKDTTISGHIEISAAGQTLAGPITLYKKEPDKRRVDLTVPEYNLSISQAFDGQKGWYTNPQTGTTEEMPDFMIMDFARQAAGTQALLDPKKAGVVYALKPKTAIEGKDHIVLEQTYPDGVKFTFCLDPETYLPTKTINRAFDMMGGEVEVESFSTDYRKVGGLMVAHAIRILHDGVEAHRITVASVAYNTGLEDGLFVLK